MEGDNPEQETERAPLEKVNEEEELEPEAEDHSSTEESKDDQSKPKDSEGFIDNHFQYLSLTFQGVDYSWDVVALHETFKSNKTIK